MRVAAKSTIAATEQTLRLLDQGEGDDLLRLPANIRHLAGGAEATLAQLIITWAQRAENPTLETYISSDAQIEDFVRRLPGLVAGLCAKVAIGHGNTGSIVERLRSAALDRLRKLQSSKPKSGYRGSSAEVVCADHLGYGHPYLLYTGNVRGGSHLRPRENFRELARWLLLGAIPGQYRTLIDAEAADAIGAMLFEIFTNTEDHALFDASGNLLDISIRGLKTSHHAIAPADLARIVGGFAPLASYCSSLKAPAGATQAHLFELSVFDSGPGFAVTWTGRPLHELSGEEEEEAVRACFGQGSAKGQSRFGVGLPLVLNLLRRQSGFLRLRTGRLSFCLDFSEPGDGKTADALQRLDPGDSSQWAPVSGSLITILIPMRRPQ